MINVGGTTVAYCDILIQDIINNDTYFRTGYVTRAVPDSDFEAGSGLRIIRVAKKAGFDIRF